MVNGPVVPFGATYLQSLGMQIKWLSIFSLCHHFDVDTTFWGGTTMNYHSWLTTLIVLAHTSITMLSHTVYLSLVMLCDVSDCATLKRCQGGGVRLREGHGHKFHKAPVN